MKKKIAAVKKKKNGGVIADDFVLSLLFCSEIGTTRVWAWLFPSLAWLSSSLSTLHLV
jgi:hypothetical protein